MKPDEMILPATGVSSPAELCSDDEVLVIEVPAKCPCGGNLWRHGSYEKALETEHGPDAVWIQRLHCRRCASNFSAFYTFLVPYKRHCQWVYSKSIETYLNGKSYASAAWAGDEIQPSTVFRVVEQACVEAEVIVQELQAECVDREIPLPEPEPCRASASKGARKRHDLSRLKQAFELIKRLTESVSCATFFWWQRVPASYGKADLVYRLSAPHGLERALF